MTPQFKSILGALTQKPQTVVMLMSVAGADYQPLCNIMTALHGLGVVKRESIGPTNLWSLTDFGKQLSTQAQ